VPDLPVACTLSPAALKARREGLLHNLVGRAERRLELAGGCRLRFAASDDILAAIARTVDAERQCCRFLRFTVTVEPGGGPILVDLTDPPGTREFLAAMLGEP
jgi:hypothetical protein